MDQPSIRERKPRARNATTWWTRTRHGSIGPAGPTRCGHRPGRGAHPGRGSRGIHQGWRAQTGRAFLIGSRLGRPPANGEDRHAEVQCATGSTKKKRTLTLQKNNSCSFAQMCKGAEKKFKCEIGRLRGRKVVKRKHAAGTSPAVTWAGSCSGDSMACVEIALNNYTSWSLGSASRT